MFLIIYFYVLFICFYLFVFYFFLFSCYIVIICLFICFFVYLFAKARSPLIWLLQQRIKTVKNQKRQKGDYN